MKYFLFFCISIFTVACKNTNQSPINIEILELKEEGFFDQAEEVKIPYDQMFKDAKRYLGIPLKKVLSTSMNIRRVDQSNIRLIFFCEDNYIVSMPLDKALSRSAYIVIKDLDAPQGKDWIDILSRNKYVSPDPAYLVWEDAPREDHSYVWPYQLKTIQIEEITKTEE